MKLTVLITSPPDREKVVAELWCDDQQWGEISQETGELKLEIYPKSVGNSEKVWVFDFDAVFTQLQEAKRELIGE